MKSMMEHYTHLATDILKVDVNAIGAILLQSSCQVLARLVVDGCIIAEPLRQELDLHTNTQLL